MGGGHCGGRSSNDPITNGFLWVAKLRLQRRLAVIRTTLSRSSGGRSEARARAAYSPVARLCSRRGTMPHDALASLYAAAAAKRKKQQQHALEYKVASVLTASPSVGLRRVCGFLSNSAIRTKEVERKTARGAGSSCPMICSAADSVRAGSADCRLDCASVPWLNNLGRFRIACFSTRCLLVITLRKRITRRRRNRAFRCFLSVFLRR